MNASSLVLGTAGHIDHGKSTLVHALTGVDPDRLAEEKKRGITIELGFAQLELPSGRKMGVVDVPGHERFVRQMVAGATGIDLALLVIAADDGIMPQTIEHITVLEALDIQSYVIALTKIDAVDEEWVDFMADEIDSYLQDTSLARAPIVPVSARTGAGLDLLKETIDSVATHAQRRRARLAMRLPVDRVFSIKGIGTVVTGTLWSGEVAVGDEVEILPEGILTRVRSIQIHGENAETAEAGNRVALNLSSVGTQDLRPGSFLSAPGAAHVSNRFDAAFRYLDPLGQHKDLESGTHVRIAHGTREVAGRILFMDGKQTLAKGDEARVQIRLEEDLPLAYQDRFIVRAYSPARILGGGSVLTAYPRRRTTLGDDDRSMLEALDAGSEFEAVEAYLRKTDRLFRSADIAREIGFEEATAAAHLSALVSKRKAVAFEKGYVARSAVVQKSTASIERTLLDFHHANPTATGISKEALRQKVNSSLLPDQFDALLNHAIEAGAATHVGGEVSHPKASAGAVEKERLAGEALLALLENAGLKPPALNALIETSGIEDAVARKALTALARDGKSVRVESDRHYATRAIDEAEIIIRAHIRENGPATAAALKDALGISRKFAMPLLEHFDAVGLTRREGDLRVLVKNER